MEQLFSHIQSTAVEALKDQYNIEVDPSSLNIQVTRKEYEGDFTIVVFPLTRFKLGSPVQIGETLGGLLQERLDYISGFNVIKGFLNLSLTADYWRKFLADTHKDDNFLKTEMGKGQTVTVEFCSPNTNKPLHLGHMRNIVLGDSLSNILEQNGFKVHKLCLFNDKGVAICKSMYAWQKNGNGETPQSTGISGDKLVGNYYVEFSKIQQAEVAALMEQGLDKKEATKQSDSQKAVEEMLIKWEAGDPEVKALWAQMNGWIYDALEKTFARLGIKFEKYYYESDIYQLGREYVEQGVESGAFLKKEDDSYWVDLTDDGLDEKILIRSNGTTVYMTQDIAGAAVRYDDYKMDRSIYVVGNEQDYHFKVLFLVLKKLGVSYTDGLFHLSYGMVDLPTGKMKSREGTTVDADDLITDLIEAAAKETQQLGKIEGLSDEDLSDLYRKLGLGALKYFLAKVDPKKRMMFDPNESVALQGNTGVFIQYSFARATSVNRKASDVAPYDVTLAQETPLNEAEQSLLRLLSQYPSILKEAAGNYNPSLVANYAYELAKTYNKFYAVSKIIDPTQPNTSSFRFALSNFAGKVLEAAVSLLGIEMPERM